MVRRLQPGWGAPFIFRRQIWRTNLPEARGSSTGVHYDQIFLRGGPADALTAWVPVGDCGPAQGGLVYLEGSVALGAALEREFGARAAAAGLSPAEARSAFNAHMDATGMLSRDPGAFGRTHAPGARWLVGDFRAGDAVFHHAHMIHSATGNADAQGYIRLSCDLRFGDRHGPYDERWDAAPHRPNDGL